MTRNTEVRIKDLTYQVVRRGGTSSEPTVGDMFMKVGGALMCLPLLNVLAHGPSKPVTRTVVRGCSGIFKPGTLTLVIGPPGCGKSSLLKLLAGQIKKDKSHKISGDILYNGQRASKAKNAPFQLPKVAAYVQQTDRHVALMTVQETMVFAFDCMEGGKHAAAMAGSEPLTPEQKELLDEPLTPEQKELLEWMDKKHGKVRSLLNVLGLANAKDTIVGDVLTRGVSGGERRRVTLGEMLAGSQDVYLMDSISNGLDSSTTYDIVSTMKKASRTFGGTIVVALLQPQPEVYALFDQVVVMADGGRIIYQGEQKGVLPYFESIGFKCPPRKDEADFVVEVTAENGTLYADQTEAGRVLPRTAQDFEDTWRASDGYKALMQELETPPNKDHQWRPNQAKLYAGTWLYHFKVCAGKHFSLFQRDTAYIRTQLLTAAMMSLVMGSIFFDLPADAINSKFGMMFFSLLFLSLNGMAQVPVAIENRHVFYKQHQQGFYPASADVAAQVCVQALQGIGETTLFAPILYFMVHLERTAQNFFVFYAMILVLNLNMAAYFRLVAAIMPNFSIAQSFAGVTLVFIVLFCGFLVPEPDIVPVFIWIYWINPISWAFRTLVLNEFLSPFYKDTCSVEVPAGTTCPLSLSDAVLGSYGFKTESAWIVGGIIFVLGLWVLTVASIAITLTYLCWDASDSAPIVEEELQLEEAGPADSSHSMAAVSAAARPHPSGDGMLELLNDITGYAKPGTLTALMGSSGAGKTTLLDVLAGRKTGGEITGAFTLNGHPKEKKAFARIAAYVEQVDVHSPVVTVREAVEFSATMRLEEADFPKAKRQELVDSILQILELDPIQGRLIGSEATGGLSGEQRKRTTIAVELASNPSLIFLDEPTTGLDARSAQVVLRAIRKVASTGRAVICTIHQPSTYLFEMFDSLLLLKKGGEVVYFGELGVHSSALIAHISAVPGTAPIAPRANPATWMLEQIGAGTSSHANPQMYADWYKNGQLKRSVVAEVERLQRPELGTSPLKFSGKYAASMNTQRVALIKRAYAQYWRSPNYNFARSFSAVIQALVFASSFVNSNPETVAQLTSVFGVIFMACNFVGIMNYQTSIPFTAMERAVFYREQASNMYAVQPFSLGHFLAEIPYLIFNTLLSTTIFYFMANLAPEAAKFFWFWFFFFLNTSAMTFLGHAMTVLLPTVKAAQSFGGVINSFFAVFGGFLISPALIPDYWIWAYYLSPLHYAIEGLLVTQFHSDDSEIVALDGTSTITVSAYLTQFFGGKYTYAHRGYDVMALLLFIIAFRLLFFYASTYVRHEKR
ncbi:ABC-2 type transporter-domain-containing protein [Tribonema minus]|uniref:ABC-2 type transporter-domain-containing protein n=1 Tax=Tribonema minus TaxID=303371 RepID=A0A835ZIR5_9STRA|nr:ABC-2 type transporter-domain-containing protein [Tribonema minus]